MSSASSSMSTVRTENIPSYGPVRRDASGSIGWRSHSTWSGAISGDGMSRKSWIALHGMPDSALSPERDRHRGLDMEVVGLRHQDAEMDEDRRRLAAAQDHHEVVDPPGLELPDRDLERPVRRARLVGMRLDEPGRQPDLDGQPLEHELEAAVAGRREELGRRARGPEGLDAELDVGHRRDDERPAVGVARERRRVEVRLDRDPAGARAGAYVAHRDARRSAAPARRRHRCGSPASWPVCSCTPIGGPQRARIAEQAEERRRHGSSSSALVGSMTPS